MKAKIIFALVMALAIMANAQQVDYSVVSTPEESGIEFVKITKESDYVCLPQVSRGYRTITWWTNRVLAMSPKGDAIAYLSYRNDCSNIFIKDINKQGSSTQRTNRTNVLDFSYSPDGKYICFSEKRGQNYQIFRTDAVSGYVCRQITSGDNDYSPIYSPDQKRIFFTRLESYGSSIWGYDVANNFLSSYTQGMNPYPMKKESALIIVRTASTGKSEIWKVNYETGVEECIVSNPKRSYTSPVVSPDGQWILFVGDSHIETPDFTYLNTDIFACRTDGTDFMQLTYHAADDLSPVWSVDGKYIYFISQRGDANGNANVWKMSFNY